MQFPFEVPFAELQADLDSFVSAIFSCLESEFLTMPKGRGFVDYPTFEAGYEALKRATSSFSNITPDLVLKVALETPVSLIAIRAMMGLTPPEWAYVATQRTHIEVSQGAARSLDRKIRLDPLLPLESTGLTAKRIEALVTVACQILQEGALDVGNDKIHRLDKADTSLGVDSIQTLAGIGVPYAMMLYERFLGRPFASHRDSVSELVGDSLEAPIEETLSKAGISHRKTKRAERILGFEQAPDFIIPSEFNPQVIIEAKKTEDDGTARDKVARIQRLAELSRESKTQYQVIACIAGRGFGVRREDMKKLLAATRGKVFTLQNLDQLVDCTRLKEFKTK